MRYSGAIDNVNDAFAIAELAIRGHHPIEKNRPNLPTIIPGSVFVFVKGEGMMERWVDGRMWAPSRFIEGFFVYNERKLSLEQELRREGAQFHVKSTHATYSLIKKVITVLAPSSAMICIVAYTTDSYHPTQSVASFVHSINPIGFEEQVSKYKYFKCFRSQSKSWRVPYPAPKPKPTSELPSLEALNLLGLKEIYRPHYLTRLHEDLRQLRLLNNKALLL
ncbi:Global transcription regulator sge1 [Entomophthora muscae]|uniref:Global transcription regulator sge1 n=1 Tax=Entomophthora muscae TaxID=34485 RepID=A0ACC2RMM1_9FUNG|nr:Global transcription regulator sge1 [Entomophthora muscae]